LSIFAQVFVEVDRGNTGTTFDTMLRFSLLALSWTSVVEALTAASAPHAHATAAAPRAVVHANTMVAPPAPPPISTFYDDNGGGDDADEYLRLIDEGELVDMLSDWSHRSRIYRMSVRLPPGAHRHPTPAHLDAVPWRCRTTCGCKNDMPAGWTRSRRSCRTRTCRRRAGASH